MLIPIARVLVTPVDSSLSTAAAAHSSSMMKAVSIAPSLASAAQARPRRAARTGSVRVAASAFDATMASGHWSGGSPLILPNGTVS